MPLRFFAWTKTQAPNFLPKISGLAEGVFPDHLKNKWSSTLLWRLQAFVKGFTGFLEGVVCPQKSPGSRLYVWTADAPKWQLLLLRYGQLCSFSPLWPEVESLASLGWTKQPASTSYSSCCSWPAEAAMLERRTTICMQHCIACNVHTAQEAGMAATNPLSSSSQRNGLGAAADDRSYLCCCGFGCNFATTITHQKWQLAKNVQLDFVKIFGLWIQIMSFDPADHQGQQLLQIKWHRTGFNHTVFRRIVTILLIEIHE